MLKKLIKHELRASGRIMLPFLAAVLILSVLTGIFTNIMNSQVDYSWFTALYGVTSFLFGAGIFAICVMSVVIMVRRFQRNLLSDEGYISFTLPVSVDEHIISKLISSFIWFAATGLVCILSITVIVSIIGNLAFDNNFLIDMTGEEGMLPSILSQIGVGNIIGYVLETIVVCFLSACSMCLHFYAAMAIGYSFDKHKGLLSIIFYFVFSGTINVLYIRLLALFAPWMNTIDLFEMYSENIFAAPHVMFAGIIAYLLILCVIYYLPTRIMLKKNLNLS